MKLYTVIQQYFDGPMFIYTDLAYPTEKLHPMVFDAMCIHIIPSMISQACIEVRAWMRNYIS